MGEAPLGGATGAEEDAQFAPDIAFVRYNNEDWGLSFRYPVGWHVIEEAGKIIVSSSVNTSKLYQDGVGSVIEFLPKPKEEALTIESLLNGIKENSADLLTVTEPHLIEVDGNQGLYLSQEGHFPRMQVDKRITYALVETESGGVSFRGFANIDDAEIYQPILDAIIFSAEFSKPSSEFLVQLYSAGQNENSEVTTILNDATFDSVKMGIAFHYPSDWSVVETRKEIAITKHVDKPPASYEVKQLFINVLPKSDEVNLAQQFAAMTDGILSQENVTVVGELRELTVAGNKGVQITVNMEDQQAGTVFEQSVTNAYTLTLVEYDGVFFSFAAFMKADESEIYRPIFDAIIDSADFSQPATESLTILEQ